MSLRSVASASRWLGGSAAVPCAARDTRRLSPPVDLRSGRQEAMSRKPSRCLNARARGIRRLLGTNCPRREVAGLADVERSGLGQNDSTRVRVNSVTKKSRTIALSSGNVFGDVGFAREEAVRL